MSLLQNQLSREPKNLLEKIATNIDINDVNVWETGNEINRILNVKNYKVKGNQKLTAQALDSLCLLVACKIMDVSIDLKDFQRQSGLKEKDLKLECFKINDLFDKHKNIETAKNPLSQILNMYGSPSLLSTVEKLKIIYVEKLKEKMTLAEQKSFQIHSQERSINAICAFGVCKAIMPQTIKKDFIEFSGQTAHKFEESYKNLMKLCSEEFAILANDKSLTNFKSTIQRQKTTPILHEIENVDTYLVGIGKSNKHTSHVNSKFAAPSEDICSDSAENIEENDKLKIDEECNLRDLEKIKVNLQNIFQSSVVEIGKEKDENIKSTKVEDKKKVEKKKRTWLEMQPADILEKREILVGSNRMVGHGDWSSSKKIVEYRKWEKSILEELEEIIKIEELKEN
ncbi:hypothetical protein HDU92_001974 [Lobulomyces angularis]|nr:hypothetical protein HDU92_001974 [Lobulomyces angularis]